MLRDSSPIIAFYPPVATIKVCEPLAAHYHLAISWHTRARWVNVDRYERQAQPMGGRGTDPVRRGRQVSAQHCWRAAGFVGTVCLQDARRYCPLCTRFVAHGRGAQAQLVWCAAVRCGNSVGVRCTHHLHGLRECRPQAMRTHSCLTRGS